MSQRLTVTFVWGPGWVEAHTYDEEGMPDPSTGRTLAELPGLRDALRYADEFAGRPKLPEVSS